MPEPIFYADLWALLRKLGFDCDTVLESNHRVCVFEANDTRIMTTRRTSRSANKSFSAFGCSSTTAAS